MNHLPFLTIKNTAFSSRVGILSILIILSSITLLAQSPTCNIPAVTAAFQGAGYVSLAVQGQPCSMYFVNPNSQDAGAAQAAAEALGANLVTMNNAAENTNVAAALAASPYNGATIWLGYQRTAAGANTFFSSDGTTGPFIPGNGNPLIYQNWAGGEPNNNGYGDTGPFGGCDSQCQNGEQCVQIYSNGQWNDLPCDANSISVIEVNLCPEITVVASTNNVCAGNPVTLTASALLGSEPYQFAWSATQLTASITVTPLVTTTYNVAVADRYECSAQETIDVAVLPGATATFDVGPAVCIGEIATITYTGSATAGNTLGWNFGTGVIQSGTGEGPYEILWATSGPQTITLQVTANGCTSPIESQTLTVSPSPTANFTATIVCQGNPTVFTNTSVGNGAVIAGSAWDFGGGNTEISTDASFTFSQSGGFSVTLGVATAAGCLGQITQQVTVNPGPTATFNSTNVVCFGDCDGTAEAIVAGGVPPLIVTWSNGNVGTNITALCAEQLTATVADANGCEVTGQVTITEPDELTVTVAVTPATCAGVCNGTALTTPTGGVAPYTVDWGGENPNALLANNYSVTVTDANNCTATATFSIVDGAGPALNFTITDNICFGGTDGAATLTIANGTPTYNMVWTDAFANPIQTDIGSSGTETLTALGAGTYNVGILDAIGCTSAASFTITQPPVNLVMNLAPQDLSCFENGDGEITANQNGLSPYTYAVSDVFGNPIETGQDAASFTFQALDIGIHFVTVTDANGCTTTDALELFEPNILQNEASVTNVLCFGEATGAIEITQITGGTTPYVPVSWSNSVGPIGQTGTMATALFAETYTATIEDVNGCTLQETFLLIEPPQMMLSPGYLTDTCGQGRGVALVEVELGTPPYTYLWKPDGATTVAYTSLFEGDYEVVVTDANGCRDSIFATVTDDLPLPVAAFDYRIEGENDLNNVVKFSNNSVGTVQWQWNFGDGNSSFDENPEYSYNKAENYLVQLLASNGFCNDTAYDYVTINPLFTIYIPNAFTPGEDRTTRDGTNDYFFPQGQGIDENSYEMTIFDRWGKLIWQTSNFKKKWDGTHISSLKPLPRGTYAYRIEFLEFADLDKYVYTGVVHLLRE